MRGDGYETRQVFLFHVFVCNYAQLICEPVRSENKRLCTVTVNSTSICDNIILVFEGFKLSYSVPRLTMV